MMAMEPNFKIENDVGLMLEIGGWALNDVADFCDVAHDSHYCWVVHGGCRGCLGHHDDGCGVHHSEEGY